MDIEQITGRPIAYNNIDGVGELGLGIFCFGNALLWWLKINTPESSVWNIRNSSMVYFLAILAIVHYGSKVIKKHLTYPRTGYVEYPSDLRKRSAVWAAIVSAGVMLAVRLGTRLHWTELTTVVALLIGLTLAGCYGYAVARKSPAWKWAVVGILVIGALAAPSEGAKLTHVFPPRPFGAFLFLFLLYGALLIISGAITFVMYVLHTRRSEVAE